MIRFTDEQLTKWKKVILEVDSKSKYEIEDLIITSPGISLEDYEKIVVSAMKRFNLTREEAIEEINKN